MSLDSPKGADSSAEFSDLRRYLRVLRNRRWSILAVLAVTVAATAAYAYLRVPAYEASSQVVVEPITLGSPQQVVDAFSLETEAAVAQSTEVARLAGERMGSEESPEALAGRVTVTVPTDTLSLLITFSHSDPQVAQQGAEAFAEAYLEYRQQQAREEAEQLAETYEDETAALQAQVAEVNLQLAESPEGSAEFRDAVVLRNLLRTELSTLRARVTVVRTADLDPGEIIVHATQPTSPVGVDNQRLLVIGVLLGLFFGVLFAFFRDRVDERPKSRIDLEEAIGAPVLALVPKVHDGAKRDAARLFTVDDPRSPAAEAFRTLGASVLVMGSERRLSSRQRRSNIKTLLVVSSLDEEGKTTTAANLGAELAQSGKRVLVISADLRKPRLHEFFRLPNERGLTQMLSGETHDWRNGPGSGVPNLWVLPSGPPVDLPAEALRSDRMRKVLLEASDVMDFVILDGHPLLLVGDSLVLASYVDGILLVVDAERTTRTAMMQTRGSIEQVGGNLVGTVVNKVEADRLGWDFVAYGYYGPAGTGKGQTAETWGAPPEVRKP